MKKLIDVEVIENTIKNFQETIEEIGEDGSDANEAIEDIKSRIDVLQWVLDIVE